VRAQAEGHAEIGVLVGTFNEMLDQIQDRDAALQRARHDLERQVDERTRDLQTEVTERRLLAEQLRENNQELEQQSLKVQEATRLKSEFLANMSHELRTPLNGIIGFAELMHDGRVGPVSGPHKECLVDILTSSRHLLQLINDVLDLSKVEAGKMEFRPEALQLPKIVGEVRDILRTISAKKRIAVTTDFEPGLEEISADPGKLKQVLYNYLSNALKFTPDGGRVIIRTKTEGADYFRIEVQDSGVGIRPEDLSRLFIEFQQLDAGTAKTHQGTGLGLALTKRIVEAQGGHVGVSSTPGEGSLFHAVLPRVARGASAAHLVLAARADAATGPTMLVIEDDATERAWLVATITAGGYTVDAAASGQEALELCRSRKYDGITLDLFLPDSTGWDILREIRRSGPNLETPVIVVTVVAEKRLGAGFAIHDYLVKPVREDQLLRSLRRAGATPADIGTILVVDDDPQARRLVDATLTGAGYRVVTVSSAEQGLRAVSNAPWAAVILDLLMPGMDGFDFLDRFRSTPQGHATPVIVWTAKDLTSDDYRRLAASAHGVVLKRQGGAGPLVEELRLHIAPSRSEPSPEPESSSLERDSGR
jgi:signal transduction histidine kinase/DNA-binding response OmpR family regulator